MSETFDTTATEFLQAAGKMGLEGIIAKKADSQYHQGDRGGDWLKIKVHKRHEVVIGGFTKNDDSPRFEPPKPCAHKVGNALACIFHQRQAGNTVALGCKAIDFAHLRSGQNFHGQSLIVVSL